MKQIRLAYLYGIESANVNLDTCVIAPGAPFSAKKCRAASVLKSQKGNMLYFVDTRENLYLVKALFVFKTTLSYACRTRAGSLGYVRPCTCFYAIVHNGSFFTVPFSSRTKKTRIAARLS
jgi:hypothetical protein